MPYKIIKLPNGKFAVINRISGHLFSKGSTKKKAEAQMRLLLAKAKELDGAGMSGGMEGDSLIYKSMSDTDLHEYFPNARVLKYSELPVETPAEDFLKKGEVVYILYEAEKNSGHWVAMCRSGGRGLTGSPRPDCIYYFDAYSNPPDIPLKWVDAETNARLGQSRKTLTQMFSITKIPVYYNNVAYQNKDDKQVATCGRWATSFLIHFKKYGGDLKSFKQEVFKQKREEKLPLDNLIATKIIK
jgi:hypothetical protein